MDTAKLFLNGRSQAVRLPKSYRFDGSEVYIKKVGDVVLLVPKEKAWEVMESGINYFSEDFLSERNQPESEKRSKL